jgi:hypothetical protein
VSAKRPTRNLRRGLHKLECDCGQGTYASWAQLERFGAALPTCSLCGDRFEPDHLELAMALGLDDSAVVVEYRAKLSSVAHGQARVDRGNGRDYSAELTAAAEIERRRVKRARAARINALRPAPEPIPF